MLKSLNIIQYQFITVSMLKKNSNIGLLGQWIEIWYCEYDGSTIHFMICILSLIPILIFEALGWPWRVLGARHTGDCHIRHQAADYRRGRKHRRDQNHRQNRGNVAKPLPSPWSAHLGTEKHHLVSSQTGLGSAEIRWCSWLCSSSETVTEFGSHFWWFLFFIFHIE